MKKVLLYTSIIALTGLASGNALAGNEDRAGQAGASEILINPWARSGGWGGLNGALVKGVESMSTNVGGMALNKGTDITFSHTDWLKGSGIKIEAVGISQKIGQTGAMGLSITSMNFGDITRTTEDQPEGGAGTFTPQFLNIGLGYSKEFSNAIRGGIVARIISESISDVKSQGFVIDAGIQYTTGFNKEHDNLKFGIALRNVGTPMKFSGEGLSARNINESQNINVLMEQRAEAFEMPSLVNISLAYDFKIGEDHRITPAAAFTSNSFTRDQLGIGIEYAFRNLVMLRGAFTADKEDKDAITDQRISSLMGPSAGITIMLPLGKSGKTLGLDYSFRSSDTFDGTHSFGAQLSL